MPNAGVVDFSTSVDIGADIYVATFMQSNGDGSDMGSESFSVVVRIADKIQLQGGEEPSYGIVNVAMVDFPNDENAFTVALKKAGPLDKIKLGMRANISYVSPDGKALPILTGTIIDINHDVGVDGGAIVIMDDRWYMAKFTCFGQLQYDPSTKIISFNASEPCTFNQFGWPDCIDHPKLGAMWAPCPRYGWGPNDVTEPAPGQAKTRARSWRVSDAIEALRLMHYSARSWPGTGIQEYGQRFMDTTSVHWPAGIGSALVNVRGQDRSQRPLHDFSVENLNLVQALQKLAAHAGPFDLFLVPGGGHGGDNGNDVMAGPIGDLGGFYSDLQTVFDNQQATLSAGFNAGFSAFSNALASATNTIQTAMTTYLKAIGHELGPAAEMNATLGNIYQQYQVAGNIDSSSGYQYALTAMGSTLDGNPGRYNKANAGSDQSNIATVNATGQSMKSLLRGAQQSRATLTFLSYQKTNGGFQPLVPGLGTGDIVNAILGNGIEKGYIKESIKDYYHEVSILGDPPAFERLFSMADSSLEKGWDGLDESYWRAYINTNGKNQKAFEEACKLYPKVFACYRVPSSFNFMEGTKWDVMYQFKSRRHPRIRSHLLTGIQPDETNPLNWEPRQIPVEYYDDADSTWKTAALYDNLKISFDGSQVILEGLRDSSTHETWTGSLAIPLSIVARNIRLTMAVEADFRIRGYVGGTDDPNNTYSRVFGRNDGFQRTTYVHVAKALDYIEWNRKDSYPIGQAIPQSYRGTPTAPSATSGFDFTNKCTRGNELFTDAYDNTTGATKIFGRLTSHAIARLYKLKKINYSGQFVLKQFDPSYLPGARINGVLDSGIPVDTGVRACTLEQNTQEMIVALG